MEMNSTTLNFLICPLGGTLYACPGYGQSGFIGCCDGDPCGPLGCSAGNLRNTSFKPQYYGKMTDQSCPDKGTLFYTCNFTQPPFWGCCKSNPCHLGACPTGDLESAAIKQTGGNTFLLNAPPAKSSKPIGAIVGGVIGAVVIVAAITITVILFMRRKRTKAVVDNPPGNPVGPYMQYASNTPSTLSPTMNGDVVSTKFANTPFTPENPSMRYSLQSGYSGYTVVNPQFGHINHQVASIQEMPEQPTPFERPVLFELPEHRSERSPDTRAGGKPEPKVNTRQDEKSK